MRMHLTVINEAITPNVYYALSPRTWPCVRMEPNIQVCGDYGVTSLPWLHERSIRHVNRTWYSMF